MAHHHPAAEGQAQPQKIVVFHAPPGGELLQPVLPVHPAVDKEEALAQQDGGQGAEKGQLRGKALLDDSAQAGKVRRALQRHPYLPGHLGEDTLLSPAKDIAVVKLRRDVGGLVHKVEGQVVAVAAEHMDLIALTQGHDIAQSGQTVHALLQHVPQEDEDVVRTEAHLPEQGLEKGEVTVYIADDQHPAARREPDGFYLSQFHGVSSSESLK